MAVLDVRNLSIAYRTSQGTARAVERVSFRIEEGEYLGLVGESGCGKSTIAKAILGILPPNGSVVGGEIRFKDVDLVPLTTTELNRYRWQEISMIPQSAMNAFDPVYTVEQQLKEAIDIHQDLSDAEKQKKIEELFELVGLNLNRLKDYPHQFSGGMRQRAMIAMALVLDPTLVVADEPTTGLDVIVQDQILFRIKKIHEELKKTMLLITHDIAVVAENCGKIAVMYAGRVMEYGGESVFNKPHHPYTLGLSNAFPHMGSENRELISIPGSPPNLLDQPRGCRFNERCPFAGEQCREEEPELQEVAKNHFSACHYLDRIPEFRKQARLPETWSRM